MPTIDVGTLLTCSGEECECRLLVERPCPHGDVYTCACGHPMHPVDPGVSDLPVTPGA